MPDYCDNSPEISEVPAFDQMEHFKPYFNTPSGPNQLVVKIKVPSECYYVEDDAPGYPQEGSCGGPNDYNHVIVLNQLSPCTNSQPKECSVTLPYTADPTGEKLVLYVQDNSQQGGVRGGSKSFGSMKN